MTNQDTKSPAHGPIVQPGFADEVFIWGEKGVAVLIWKLIDSISQMPEVEVQTWWTSALLKARRSDRISEEHIAKMSPERMSQPLLICGVGDELWILDGNHRLEARHRAGLEETDAILIEDLEGCFEPLPW